MLFQSYVFILVFLPVAVVGIPAASRFLFPKGSFLTARWRDGKQADTVYHWGHILLLLLSLVFYAWLGAWILLVFLEDILVNAGLNLWIGRHSVSISAEDSAEETQTGHSAGLRREASVRAALILGVVGNILLLVYFKYTNFFLGSLNQALGHDYNVLNIVVPTGLSFYTFQQIAYLVDNYRGERREDSVLDYLLYITFFPKLLSGPITLPTALIPQFRDSAIITDAADYGEETSYGAKSGEHKVTTDTGSGKTSGKTFGKASGLDLDAIAQGLVRFVLGLSKKVLIADLLGNAVNWGFGNIDALTAGDVWVIMIAYSFEIYFDFSGYSDMALGIARMIGFELPVNFESPYMSLNINDFWKRWHISLTGFLRKYLYFPLGGNRKGKLRAELNMFIVFLISGLWHGASWTFVLWGSLHGIIFVLYRKWGRFYDKLHLVFQWGINFLVVSVLWLLFRADSLGQWSTLMQRAFKLENMALSPDLLGAFRMTEAVVLTKLPLVVVLISKIPAIFMVGTLLMCFWICLNGRNLNRRNFRLNAGTLLITLFLLVWCMLTFSSVSTYVYSNF